MIILILLQYMTLILHFEKIFNKTWYFASYIGSLSKQIKLHFKICKPNEHNEQIMNSLDFYYALPYLSIWRVNSRILANTFRSFNKSLLLWYIYYYLSLECDKLRDVLPKYIMFYIYYDLSSVVYGFKLTLNIITSSIMY